jgi:hypothetical protein
VPLALVHEDGLRAAAADGELWNIRVTSVPEPHQTRTYIEDALAMRAAGNRFAFAVLDSTSGTRAGLQQLPRHPARRETPGDRLHLVRPKCAAQPRQHHRQAAADAPRVRHPGLPVVGWRTDNFNFASQAAIERLGAKKDGVIRGHALRRDGTIRDTVMYSLRAGEWPEAKAQLLYLLERRR